jgi:gamma-glutamylcyclotransferase (GGCT)/AIG2-like uncharacterized protein YtfP
MESVVSDNLPLFVYGTLLDESVRDSVLGSFVLRSAPATARGRWERASGYPAASFSHPATEIAGELVWLVPEVVQSALRRADQYEGVPEALFRRVRIWVRSGRTEVEAYAYEWAEPG